MNISIVKEQQQIAYRCFLSNAQQVLQALDKGISLSELADTCEAVCCHTCTNSCKSELCNVHLWIYVLFEIDKSCLLQTRIHAFLEYILLQHKDKMSFGEKFKILILSNTVFYKYELIKRKLIDLLSSGYSISDLVDNFDLIVESDENSSALHNWLLILQRVEVAEIIPGGNLLEFLKFI